MIISGALTNLVRIGRRQDYQFQCDKKVLNQLQTKTFDFHSPGLVIFLFWVPKYKPKVRFKLINLLFRLLWAQNVLTKTVWAYPGTDYFEFKFIIIHIHFFLWHTVRGIVRTDQKFMNLDVIISEFNFVCADFFRVICSFEFETKSFIDFNRFECTICWTQSFYRIQTLSNLILKVRKSGEKV